METSNRIRFFKHKLNPGNILYHIIQTFSRTYGDTNYFGKPEVLLIKKNAIKYNVFVILFGLFEL